MFEEQKIQEDQYAFPYHYLPYIERNEFHQHAYWSWGFRYLGGMHVVNSICNEESYESLLDLGCGDGRFISNLSRASSTVKLLGVDYSKRAIGFAKAFNPALDYRAVNIMDDDLGGSKFDVVTLIEVLEHIPPEDLPEFVERAVSFLRPGGRLVSTVPHKNKPVSGKHFQHFDSTQLTILLSPYLEDLKFQPFDVPSKFLNIWFRLMGGSGEYFIVTWRPLLSAFYKYYLCRYLFGQDEHKCSRIACVGRKRGAHIAYSSIATSAV